jgi:hypothetical protein
MKGDIHIDTIVFFGILILVVFILFYFGANLIIPAKASMNLDFQIKQLCSDWAKQNCDKDVAATDLNLRAKIGDKTLFLSQMCSLLYTGVETNWNEEVYEKCKNSGCPGACPTKTV